MAFTAVATIWQSPPVLNLSAPDAGARTLKAQGTIMRTVPLIDLAPARRGGRPERARVAAAIDTACREIGFFAISGHGVPGPIVGELRRLAHEFFALPVAAKLAACHPIPGVNRGYHPIGGEALAQANDAPAPPDLKEFSSVTRATTC